MKKLIELFISIFKIGAFTFGGGYAMIPLIEEEVVKNKGWLSKEEFVDILVVAQSLPGALAVNTSVFLGYKISGIFGAITALLAVVLPSFFIILLIAMFFMQFRSNYYVNAAFKGITAAVPILVLIIISLVVLMFFDIHPVIVIIISGVYGAIFLRKKVN